MHTYTTYHKYKYNKQTGKSYAHRHKNTFVCIYTQMFSAFICLPSPLRTERKFHKGIELGAGR